MPSAYTGHPKARALFLLHGTCGGTERGAVISLAGRGT